MRTFVDTSAFYTLLDRSDRRHHDAATAWTTLLDGRTRMVTHNYVLVETTALLQHRIGVEAVDDLRRHIGAVVDTLWVGADDHEAALIAVTSSKQRDISLVDRVSFHVMRRLGIEHAFAFDQHFASEGFALVA